MKRLEEIVHHRFKKNPWAYLKVHVNGLVHPQTLILALFTHRHANHDFLSLDEHVILNRNERYFEEMFSIQ